MGKTYTDFSQLSKGMFRTSDPVVEVKPLPPKKAVGDDALAYFGIGGTGNGERGTGNGERGAGNGERGTGNGERGTGSRERGTGNGERLAEIGVKKEIGGRNDKRLP